jgi:hypothetical protein
MARLSIEFGESTERSGKAKVRAEILNARGIRVWQGALSLHGALELELSNEPTGDYVVRAELPSGEWLDAQVTVPADGSGHAVLRSQQPSPSETMDWAYYIKGVSRTARSDVADIERLQPSLRSLSAGVRADLWVKERSGHWVQLTADNPSESRFLIGDIDLPHDPYLIAGFEPRSSSRELHCFQITAKGSPSKFVILPPADRARVLICLDSLPSTPGDPFHIVVDGPDPAGDALMTYLISAELSAARIIGDDFVRSAAASLDDTENPLPILISGYYLIGAKPDCSMPDWFMPSDRFPWLPDVPVLHAAFLLRQSGDKHKLAAARDLLLEAERRGPPCFTQGLRLLVDGLNILDAIPELVDDVTRDARSRALQLASACDWRVPNTTFVGDDPATPKPFVPSLGMEDDQ